MKISPHLIPFSIFISFCFAVVAQQSEPSPGDCGTRLASSSPLPSLQGIRVTFARRVQEKISAKNLDARQIAHAIRTAIHEPWPLASVDGALYRLVLEDSKGGPARLVEFGWTPGDDRIVVTKLRSLAKPQDQGLRTSFYSYARLRTEKVALGMSLGAFENIRRIGASVADLEHAFLHSMFPPIERVDGDVWLMGISTKKTLLSVQYLQKPSHNFIRQADHFGAEALDPFLLQAAREKITPQNRLDITRGTFARINVYYGRLREAVIRIGFDLKREDVVEVLEECQAVLRDQHHPGPFLFAARNQLGVPIKVVLQQTEDGDVLVISASVSRAALTAFEARVARASTQDAG